MSKPGGALPRDADAVMNISMHQCLGMLKG